MAFQNLPLSAVLLLITWAAPTLGEHLFLKLPDKRQQTTQTSSTKSQ